MSSTTKKYPLSTPDGISIPLDVVKPVSVVRKTFSSVTSAEIAIPTDIEIISFITSEDCWITFGAASAVPADGVVTANVLFLRKNLRTTVAPPLATFSVIRDTADGFVVAQYLDKWAALTLSTQQSRR